MDVEDLDVRVYKNNNATINTSTWITDDEKYIGVDLYLKDAEIKFEVVASLGK